MWCFASQGIPELLVQQDARTLTLLLTASLFSNAVLLNIAPRMPICKDGTQNWYSCLY